MKKIIVFFLFLFIALNSFAQKIINPSQGTWANKQALVLELPFGANAYYSVNGTNPENSGFAYDGPVLLDLIGDVNLSVVVIDKNGEKSTHNVSYSVSEKALDEEVEYSSFVKKITSNVFVEYTSGEIFEIPSTLEYSMGALPEIFEPGKSLAISADSIFSRYLPCSVSNGEETWRFVIKVIPSVSGIYSRKDVPFEIEDWETINFTDAKMIYKIDNQWWELPKLPVKLDRTVSHMISWQSIDYSNENPVNFFVLPAKPEVVTSTDKCGVVSLKLNGEDGYKFGLMNEVDSSSELFDSITLDTFQGDSYQGNLSLGIFYDSVYQGKYDLTFNVHKKIPLQPKILFSSDKKVSRDSVDVKLNTEFDNKIFYCVAGPVILTQEDYSDAQGVLVNLDANNYSEYKNSFSLQPLMDGAALYKIFAYSVDSYGNKSKVVEDSVIIDQCNYYVDARNQNENPDGSKSNPFTSFEQCVDVLDKSRYVNIRIFGDVEFPKGKTVFSSNCEISGFENARIIFPQNSSIIVRNSSFIVRNALLEHKGFSSRQSSFIELQHSVLDLSKCEVMNSFEKNGTLINSDKSVIVLNDCGMTIKSKVYASIISSIDSKISINKSRLSSISNTSVVFSLQGGIFDLSNSECKIFGGMGRVAELFDTHSSIYDNVFTAELSNSKGVNNPIYKDSKNITVKESENIVTGF